MSEVFKKISAASLQARKDRDAAKSKTLIPLVADIQKISKDKQREVTDDDCYAVLKSTIKNVQFNIEKTTGEAKADAEAELILLKSFLPEAPSQEVVDAAIAELKAQGLNKGLIIKGLKERFGTTLDVAEIAKTL